MKEDVMFLIKNMPKIMAYMNELNSLVNNLPKEPVSDLTITIGKSTIRVNRDKDTDLYSRFLETINSTSSGKISSVRDAINNLLYETPSEFAKDGSAIENM
jgi:hypothetical protein